ASAGVRELAARLIATDLSGGPAPERERLPLGDDENGGTATLDPYGDCVLICGASASGKSTGAPRIVETLLGHQYQLCVIDPEGDYAEQPGAVVLGKPDDAPRRDEAMQLLEDYGVSNILCLTGVPISDRPQYFAALLSDLLKLRGQYGRPHWIVIDEAHHLMPRAWLVPEGLLPEQLINALLVTVHPELLSQTLLERVTKLIAVGPTAREVVQQFAELRGLSLAGAARKAALDDEPPEVGEALVWSLADG